MLVPSGFESKMMEFPSGDQTGSSSRVGKNVNRDSVERTRSRIHKSWLLPADTSTLLNTTRCSSGESAKSYNVPDRPSAPRRLPFRSNKNSWRELRPKPAPIMRTPFSEDEKKPRL